MNKAEFLSRLSAALSKLPKHEIDQSVAFYAEMIDDRVEDGMDEQEAVASLGDIDEIATQIINETPIVPKTIAKAKTGSRTLNIVLLIVFSPIWLPLAFALIATVFAIYFAVWAVIFSLWMTVLAIALSGALALIAAFVLVPMGFPLPALLSAGMGFACIGISLFCVFGVLAASKGLFNLTKIFGRKVRALFVKEGGAQ